MVPACCIPRAGQGGQGGQGCLSSTHTMGSRAPRQCCNANNEVNLSRGKPEEQHQSQGPKLLVSWGRVRVWDWDSWLLLATRPGLGSHLMLLHNNHPQAPMVALPWSRARAEHPGPVCEMQPCPGDGMSPALGRRFYAVAGAL